MKENKPSVKEIFTKTLKIIGGHKKVYALIIVFCLLAALFNSLAPYFLGFATDSLYNSVTNKTGFDYEYLTKILLLVFGCYTINAVCTYFKSYLSY